MDFFISYTKADLAWAEWIAWQLEDNRFSTVIQAWDFRAGCNFVLEMDNAAKRAQRTIAVLSPNYVNAAFTHPEWASAFARDPTGENSVLLPIRVHECTPTGLLAQVVYIDLVGLSEVEAKNRLLSQVHGGRGKPAVAPPFAGQANGPAAKTFPYPAANFSRDAAEAGSRVALPLPAVASEIGLLTNAEQDLVPYVGPIAKVLVRHAAAKATTAKDLYAELAKAIPLEDERQEFLRRTTDRYAAGGTCLRPPPRGSQPSDIFSPSLLEQLCRELTAHLGPVAKATINWESGRARTLHDLYQRLGNHLPAGAERLAFLKRAPKVC